MSERTYFNKEISRIKLPDDSIMALRSRWDTEVIVGTQTTLTSAWTGVTTAWELYTGMQILYWLPMTSTSTEVTLKLTYKTSSTVISNDLPVVIKRSDGWKIPVTTQYMAGRFIKMVYCDSSLNMNGANAFSSPCWLAENYVEPSLSYTFDLYKSGSEAWDYKDDDHDNYDNLVALIQKGYIITARCEGAAVPIYTVTDGSFFYIPLSYDAIKNVLFGEIKGYLYATAYPSPSWIRLVIDANDTISITRVSE